MASLLKTFGTLLLALLVPYVVRRWIDVRRALSRAKYIPGSGLAWLNPTGLLTIFLGDAFPPKGWIGHYSAKFQPFLENGTTVTAAVAAGSAQTVYLVADAAVTKIVTSDRHQYFKHVADYRLIDVYGPNVLSTEGADWKRHRHAAMAAFSEANNAFVWETTMSVLKEWFSAIDAGESVPGRGTVKDINSDMTHLTFLVICAAGFGMRVPWDEVTSGKPPPGYELTFAEAMTTACKLAVVNALVPESLAGKDLRIPYVSGIINKARQSFQQLELYINSLITNARTSEALRSADADNKEADLLKRLVQANETTDARGERLADPELVSNVFTFLLAGHETSAHTLTFAIFNLAFYPEIQKKIRAEARSLWPDSKEWPDNNMESYKRDFPALEYTLAVFRETLRHFPAEPKLTKYAASDCVLNSTLFEQRGSKLVETGTLPIAIPKGSPISLSVWALHHNPLYWGEDYDKFVPEKFIDTPTYHWPRDAFLAFSGGPRGCIGTRFSMTESVLILALLLRRYEILVPPELEGFSFDEQKTRMLGWTTGITLTPTYKSALLRRVE